MNDKELISALSKLPTGSLCNAHPGVIAMSAGINPLFTGARLAGPAITASTPAGQNAAIHRAVFVAEAGDVLVVDGGGSRHFGPFGDILAAACQLKGVGGLVIDSTVRDIAEIRAMKFPVFCLGANPTATEKSDPGHINVPICCAGTSVMPGDIIVGDEDGVVVVPLRIARNVVAKAEAIIEREEIIKAALAQGKSTCEIFNIPVADG